MTFQDEYDLRQQRDDDLVDGFRDRAWYMMKRYQEWIEQELKSSIPKADILEVAADGEVKRRLQLKINRMKQISLHELPEAINNIAEKCNELRRDGSVDILEDYQYLQECLSVLHGFVRELLDIRRLLENIPE